jgi:hypothetical protein
VDALSLARPVVFQLHRLQQIDVGRRVDIVVVGIGLDVVEREHVVRMELLERHVRLARLLSSHPS